MAQSDPADMQAVPSPAAVDNLVEIQDVHYSVVDAPSLRPDDVDPAWAHHRDHGPQRHREDHADAPDHGTDQAHEWADSVRWSQCFDAASRGAVQDQAAHGHAVQNGALLTDRNVFENVAFPLREHTRLTNPLIRHIVLTKLQAVGLRGAAGLTVPDYPAAWHAASHWRAPWPPIPNCSFTTNHSRDSIPSRWE